MHILFRKHNYKNIRLDDDTADSGETVGVMTKSGKIHEVRWMGFISRAIARESTTGKSVKLQVARVNGVDLQAGQYVHGCLLPEGVYAVLDSKVAVI